jgi:CRP/FNR family transcriptional regulator
MSGLKEPAVPTGIGAACDFCGAASYSICGALTPEQLAELDRMAKRAVYAPKDSLFSQGEPATKVFNVSEGVVRLYKLLPDGRRQVIGFKLPGDFIGLAAAEMHGLSADAVNQVAVCWFPKQAFVRFSEDKLALLRRLNEFANRELSYAQDRMLLLGRYSAEEKMASFILGWRDRLARLGRATDEVGLPMSRRDIADYLGLTIETVSRTFTKLERDKIFAVVAGGVRVVDEKRAAQLAAAQPAKA